MKSAFLRICRFFRVLAVRLVRCIVKRKSNNTNSEVLPNDSTTVDYILEETHRHEILKRRKTKHDRDSKSGS